MLQQKSIKKVVANVSKIISRNFFLKSNDVLPQKLRFFKILIFFITNINFLKREVLTEPAGDHFINTPGHSVSDLRGCVLEKVREHFYIQKFDSYRNGLNKEP